MNRIGTLEFWNKIWYYWVYPMEIKILKDTEYGPLKKFLCQYCQKMIEAESFEKHLSYIHDISIEKYERIFKKSL